MVEAVVEAGEKGQHEEQKAFYGRFSDGSRAITNPGERYRYRMQVWGT